MAVSSVGVVSVICGKKDQVWIYKERWNLKSITEMKIGSDREKEAPNMEVESAPYTSI